MAAKDEEEEEKVHRCDILYPSHVRLFKSGQPTVGQLPPNIFYFFNIAEPTWPTPSHRRAADRFSFRATKLTHCNQIGGML
jgi:hypothetical protein